jgi:ADP-heptose:LPS heptosyltransferase
MKIISLRKDYPGQSLLLDLQTMQLAGHRPLGLWSKKHNLIYGAQYILSEAIYSCLMGQLEGVAGSQYDLTSVIEDVDATDLELYSLPERLTVFPDLTEIQGKRILISLAHPAFGVGDAILAIPFLKLFKEVLNLRIGVSVNSTAADLVQGYNLFEQVYTEIIDFQELSHFDYVIEPSVEKMDTLGWIRSYVLKEFGENVFYRRFPSPEMSLKKEKYSKFLDSFQKTFNLEKSQRLCFLNWESNSIKRNIPVEVVKSIIESLKIMDIQVAFRKPLHNLDGIYDWLIQQPNTTDCTSITQTNLELAHLIKACDFVISSDSTEIHLAGGLRKKALCVFLKTSMEAYSKAWLKGHYWPGKIDRLYPTVKNIFLPNTLIRDFDKSLYQIIRNLALEEDPEFKEMYGNLFEGLKHQQMFEDLLRIFMEKRIPIKHPLKAQLQKLGLF